MYLIYLSSQPPSQRIEPGPWPVTFSPKKMRWNIRNKHARLSFSILYSYTCTSNTIYPIQQIKFEYKTNINTVRQSYALATIIISTYTYHLTNKPLIIFNTAFICHKRSTSNLVHNNFFKYYVLDISNFIVKSTQFPKQTRCTYIIK
jgi:hypothetical protein